MHPGHPLGRKPCSPRAPRHLRKPGRALREAVLESGPRQGPQRPQPPALRCDDDPELTSTKSVDSETLPPLTSQRLRLRPSLDSLSTSRPLAVHCWCSNERQGRRRCRVRSLVRIQRGGHQRRRGSFPHRWVHERQGEGHGARARGRPCSRAHVRVRVQPRRPRCQRNLFAASGSSVPGLSPTSSRVFTDTVPLISSPLAAAPQATRSASSGSSRSRSTSRLHPYRPSASPPSMRTRPSSPPAGRPSSSTSPTSPSTFSLAVAASARARMKTAADARPVGLPRRRRTTGE
ncbi:hypothetical protein K438DRAFT_1885124 [Mycena galopus ATCC 62051]|nr:hypothetical protein K438DRAFT_1885124 [Mycena galopus ATCC 62051]